jgi:LytTr DNA-binding domain
MMNVLLLPFPFYFNDDLKNALLAVFTSLFVVGFIFVYTPFNAFNAGQTAAQVWASGFITLGILWLNLIILPKLLPRLFEVSEWNVMKYLLFNVWLFLSIGIANTLLNIRFFCTAKPIFDVVLYTNLQVVFIGIFPLFFVTFLLRNRMLAENLKNALMANQKIEAIKSYQQVKEKEIHIQTETTETLSLELSDFLYAEAQNNYSLIFYKQKEATTKRLLRVTLKNLESQLNNQFIIRCHRSYLVNISAITRISGNANGYKLKVQDREEAIPVSRSKGREIIQQIREIKDVLDIL